ncbi:MAG: right-handed parallel beta-helix repeat-containing protein [Prevotella sp.]|nr:right-handed parallel beta-helix repeat-containing protein [Prevotella sp.]
MRRTFSLLILLAGVICSMLGACSDDDYTTSSSAWLTFSADTISFDTVFATIPTAMKDFWVYNTGKSHIRLASVQQQRGNQSGFRVNVDGIYLGNTTGWQTTDVEVRAGDSIRVFVELTANSTGDELTANAEDNIVFTLESGNVQKVCLTAVSLDADILTNPVISENTTYTADKPIIIYGGLTIEEGVTLTLDPGTTLYMHDLAGIDVYGTLLALGEPGREVVMRGYRIDRMFDYLPYDGVSGQWQGVHLYETSYGNRFEYTNLHSAFNGIEIDSADVNRNKLTLESATIHNCQGYCITSRSASLTLHNCQLSNALDDCFNVDGGNIEANNCTFAQFYPFDANRGVAFRFAGTSAPANIICNNSLITGYSSDELQAGDSLYTIRYRFDDCIIRTVQDASIDTLLFAGTRFETSSDDTPNGSAHFAKFDTDNLQYDFSLGEDSPCVDAANPLTALPNDRNGLPRDDKPDIGAYELTKQEE